jgi:hypothetical protein
MRPELIADAGAHRADQADVIDDLGEMRKKLAQLHPAFAVLREFPRRSEDLRRGLGEVVVFDLAGEVLAVVLRQHRLRIEEVHLRGTAHHEERDHRLRLAGEMLCLGEQVELRIGPEGGFHRRAEETVLLQQGGKGEGAESEAVRLEEMAARAEAGGLHSR